MTLSKKHYYKNIHIRVNRGLSGWVDVKLHGNITTVSMATAYISYNWISFYKRAI